MMVCHFSDSSGRFKVFIGGDVSVVFGLLKVIRIQFLPIKVIYGH